MIKQIVAASFALLAILVVILLSPKEFPSEQISRVIAHPAIGQKVSVTGNPVLLSQSDTPWGSATSYALRDSTGQMPVSGMTLGWEENVTIGVTGTISQVCIQYNATSCRENQLGIMRS